MKSRSTIGSANEVSGQTNEHDSAVSFGIFEKPDLLCLSCFFKWPYSVIMILSVGQMLCTSANGLGGCVLLPNLGAEAVF